MMSYCARLEMNRLRIAINSIALNHPSRGLSGSTSTSTFFCRFKSTSKTPKPSQHHDSTQQVADLNQTVVELSTLFSRVLAAFGILHVVTEYGFDLTRCEGPSMLPTINCHGEIIILEKISHRIYGIEGGSSGERRAKSHRSKQKEWERQEQKMFLASSKRMEVYEPTWFERKPLEANNANHRHLSSISQRISRFASGINVGDVIVIEHPEREGTVCKRVLGLPGDLILRPRQRFLSSADHRDVMDIFGDSNDTDVDNSDNVASSLSESLLEIVPDGHLWVEGDNSLNSADSRNYGSVPSALVVGKVWLRVWPMRGEAVIVRGGRPMPPKHAPFTGSTAIPAGCEGGKLVNAC